MLAQDPKNSWSAPVLIPLNTPLLPNIHPIIAESTLFHRHTIMFPPPSSRQHPSRHRHSQAEGPPGHDRLPLPAARRPADHRQRRRSDQGNNQDIRTG